MYGPVSRNLDAAHAAFASRCAENGDSSDATGGVCIGSHEKTGAAHPQKTGLVQTVPASAGATFRLENANATLPVVLLAALLLTAAVAMGLICGGRWPRLLRR